MSSPTSRDNDTLEAPPAVAGGGGGGEAPVRADEEGLLPLRVGEPGGLEVRAELGAGAMGTVLLAAQRSLGREVALKVLREGARPFERSGLLTEARIMGQLEHPSIVPVHELGLDERGLPALVMKRVSGVPWSRLLTEPSSPLLKRFGRGEGRALDAHVDILKRVCDAVHFAHQRGVVHRDIKPENVMVGEHGEVYLLDWGIATTMLRVPSADGKVVGTPGYMAPEMVLGQAVDATTDVYLLGATLHVVLTGRVRNEGATHIEMMKSAATQRPYAYGDEVPTELAALCNAATSLSRQARPTSAEAFREGLDAWQRHRASHQLCREARQRLSMLEEMMGAGKPDAAALMRLSTECRFGFAQALREWPESGEAKRGLRACLKLMVKWAVSQGDAATARGLLAELDRPSEHLAVAVSSLEREVTERKELVAKAGAMVRQRDLRVGGGDRLRLLIMMVTALLVLRLGLIMVAGPERASEPSTLLWVGLFAFALFGAGVAALRRELFETQVNRHVVVMLLVILFGIVINRGRGILSGDTGGSIMAGDSLIAALTAALAASSVRRQIGWTALINLVGAAVSTVRPELAAHAFTVSSIGGLVWVAYVLDRYREDGG